MVYMYIAWEITLGSKQLQVPKGPKGVLTFESLNSQYFP